MGKMGLRTRSSLIALATILLPVALAGRVLGAAQGSFERTLKVTGPVELTVTTGSGRIDVSSGGASTVLVRGTIRATSAWGLSAEERVSRIESKPPIEQDGNVIRVGRIRERELSRNVSISYELVVPVETRLRSETGSGDLTVKGLRGPVDADTGSGNITISSIADDVKANTGSGDIRLTAVKGSVHADTGSGSIRGTDLSNGIWADTGSGTVEVRGVYGRVRADTGSGNISAEGTPSSEWRLTAGSGNIVVRLPARMGFNLHAHAEAGRVSVARPLTLQGTLGQNEIRGKSGDGGPLLEVRSGSGDIRIE
jgi:putative adhesin